MGEKDRKGEREKERLSGMCERPLEGRGLVVVGGGGGGGDGGARGNRCRRLGLREEVPRAGNGEPRGATSRFFFKGKGVS